MTTRKSNRETTRSERSRQIVRTAEQRIQALTEGWFITDPLLFGVWTMHQRIESPSIQTIRVGEGRVQYNSKFVLSLSEGDLREVLRLEAVRILLKHPYERKKPAAALSYLASNITLQEYLSTPLPIPKAHDVFGTHAHDRQYFELYYERLKELAASASSSQADEGGEESQQGGQEPPSPQALLPQPAKSDAGEQADAKTPPLPREASGLEPTRPEDFLNQHLDPNLAGPENTLLWDQDEFLVQEVNQRILDAHQTNNWGTLSSQMQSILVASLAPKLNYRKMLRAFRASIISSRRRLTRMKPSRRYGFENMGSRHSFSTRLLFAVDVSGSVSDRDLQKAYALVNRLFRFGIERIEVLQFDTTITSEVQEFTKARETIQVIGRGGTSFTEVLRYIDDHRDYDGLIIFTDGYAPVPSRPSNRRTRILWLFNTEQNYQRMRDQVQHIGKAAFIRERR